MIDVNKVRAELLKISAPPTTDPATLTFETFIKFPRQTKSRQWLNQFDKYCQKEVGINYAGMRGRSFFFRFASDQQRETFLRQMQAMMQRHGDEVQRTTI